MHTRPPSAKRQPRDAPTPPAGAARRLHVFIDWPDICELPALPLEGRENVSERSNHDRLRRVEAEVEGLLADVREQVQRLRAMVERIRDLRGSGPSEAERALAYGGGARSDWPAGPGGAPRHPRKPG
jgi:hypothetical protein